MNVNAIMQALSQFFPNKDINGIIKQGQEQIKGVANTKESVVNFIRSRGIMDSQIDKVAEYIRTNPAAKVICRLSGTNPVALINDIKSLKSTSNNTNPALAPVMAKPKINGQRKFMKI